MSEQETTWKVQNWSEYNDALVGRGSLTVWMSPETVQNWEYDGPAQQGAQYEYTDLAIKTCLEVKLAYGLTLRQVGGFVTSIFDMMDVDLDVPDYTLLSKRHGDVEVDLWGVASGAARGVVSHLVMDATGLKVHGEGEWKQRTHGKQKRRTWRKLHLGVDAETGMITATTLTDNTKSDASQVGSLLEETQSGSSQSEDDGGLLVAYAGGAYDTWDAREAITDRAATPMIPPQKNAKIKKHGNASGPPLARDEAIRYIRSHGRSKWKREHNYHRRSLGETAMYRFKQIIGRFVKARQRANEKGEVKLAAKVLNKMTSLGMQETVKIAV
jgi:hypothetical protein